MAARSRRWLIPLVLIGLIMAALLAVRSLMQPERISALLLTQLQTATGFEFRLQRPADVGLWPDLHLALEGLDVRASGAQSPFLRVTRMDLALPWSVLHDDSGLHIRRLRLIEPELDLRVLADVLSHRGDAGPPAPLRIPRLDSPLQIRDGIVRGEDWRLEAVSATLPALRERTPARLEAQAILVAGDSRQAFALQLATTPDSDGTRLTLMNIRLDLQLDALPDWQPRIEGHMAWQPAGALDFTLQTRVAPWPASWPALPLPESDAPTAISLRYQGDSALTGDLQFSLLRDDEGLRGQMRLNDSLAWLGSPHDSPLPPVVGQVEIPRLQRDGVEATGVRISIDTPDAPTP
ncbi:MAG TPA: hypothetical protein VFN29_02925 [Chiayiivirga sp.]|nr:hypothetical protein [Chiayiivirga sp.]